MTERDDLLPTQPREAGGTSEFIPLSGDPSLELFGQGWSPDYEASYDVGSYQGRHRAEDA